MLKRNVVLAGNTDAMLENATGKYESYTALSHLTPSAAYMRQRIGSDNGLVAYSVPSH